MPTNGCEKVIPELSIIIPTFNEEKNLTQLLTWLPLSRRDIEVIVCDGKSFDKTLLIAKNFNVITTSAETSRGRQLNQGLKESSGHIIWFLHADSCVSERHVDVIIRQFSRDTRIIGGNFSIEFEGDDPFSLWLNRFYSAIRKRGFYYGDSGIFISRKGLALIGGLSNRAVMEDYDLVRRMETKRGRTICIATPTIISSSRRFKGRKKSRIILGWIAVHLMFYLRVPDRLVALFYDSIGKKHRSVTAPQQPQKNID